MAKYDNGGQKLLELDVSAEDVPYDNSTSGLAATNVKSALDELAENAVTSGVYAGYCTGSAGASAALTLNPAATGWTVARQAVGRFRITHSLGLANAKNLAVTANVTLAAGGTDDRHTNVTNENVNYFEIHVFDAGAGDVDDDFYFHAVLLVAP